MYLRLCLDSPVGQGLSFEFLNTINLVSKVNRQNRDDVESSFPETPSV